MSRLLGDEEIEKILDATGGSLIKRVDTFLRAQDVKTERLLIEELDTPCMEHIAFVAEVIDSNAYHTHRKNCPECWREIKNRIK
jgi:hypothetical protein